MDGVPDIIPNGHPVTAQRIGVRLMFGHIIPIALEDVGEIKDPSRAFKEAGAGKETKTVAL
jgi:hypothetical protein